jgi:hypothetical protein
MKYDDASWHSGGQFPSGSPPEYGGTHIGLFLKWCILKGWAGELHTGEDGADIERVRRNEMTGTQFLFKNCDGKFTDEDLSAEGNAFTAKYYPDNYLGDYADLFAELLYVAAEQDHDFKKLASMLDRRLSEQTKGARKPWWKR